MQDVETGLFTVGVFQDVNWATRGVEGLKTAGFPVESITILGKDSHDLAALMASQLGASGDRMEVPGLGAVLVRGPLLEALDGAELKTAGLGATMWRAGFQQHDGRIYEALTARGGILVAVRSEPAAAAALALLLTPRTA